MVASPEWASDCTRGYELQSSSIRMRCVFWPKRIPKGEAIRCMQATSAAQLDDAASTQLATEPLPARVSVGSMGAHRDRLAVEGEEGAAMLSTYADCYVAVVYLRGTP